MIARIAVSFAIALLLLASSAGMAKAEYFSVILPDRNALTFPLPPGWTAKLLPREAAAYTTARMQPKDGRRSAVLVTPFVAGPSTPPDFDSPDNIRRAVKSLAADALPRAVEDQLTIEPIGGGKVGYMFSATDKSLAGRLVPPDQFLYVAQGLIVVGKLFCTFTILTNDRPSSDTEQALEMLRDATHHTSK